MGGGEEGAINISIVSLAGAGLLPAEEEDRKWPQQ